MKEKIFRDRSHAGQLLAEALMKYADRDDVIVLGLPRGGVPVAYEVAMRLHAPLDVLVVRKLGVPGYEELAMGAIASGGVQVIHHAVMHAMGIPRAALEAEAAVQLKELHRRELAYRGHAGTPEVRGRIVILVDDGIATGSTIRAAVQALRQQHPKQIIIAVPTASPGSCADLEPIADDLVALMTPENFLGVGRWYEDFSQTTDAEVTQLLAKASDLEPAPML
ncbi:MAG: phosphoribosyltransferase [Prosthecobacter sp.]|nr:phosphoribosyltransferase [Prosthecobacter sp.]